MLGVTLHEHPLGVTQRSRFAEDVVGHADLADVVKERAAAQHREVLGGHGELADDQLHVLDHATRMTLGLAVPNVQRVRERLQRRVVRALGLGEGRLERVRLGHDLSGRAHVNAAQHQPEEERGGRDDHRGRHLHLPEGPVDRRQVSPHDRRTDDAVAFAHRDPCFEGVE